MSDKRNLILFSIFFTLFMALAARIFYYQVCIGKTLSSAASAQRITNADLERPRGDILDRSGIPLTDRTKKYTAVLKPLYLKNSPDELSKICEVLELDFYKMKREVEMKREPILFETTSEKKDLILSMSMNGVSFITSLKRYDNTSVARHIVGYLNRADQVGQTGIEKHYEDILKYNKQNTIGVVTDAKNNLVQGLGYRLVKPGSDEGKLNIKLTLDYHIQKIVEDVMNKNNITGAVVVEEVHSGDIAAIASKPDFDQNEVEKHLQSPQNDLFNRAVASYNLGSIFKIIDVALLFSLGEDAEEKYYCHGFIKVGDKEFKCSSYNEGGHGLVDLNTAFAKSCNPYFINMGIKMGYKNIINMAQSFGMGSFTGVKDQGINESRGNLPAVSRYYSYGDIANISIGQGEIMATPLQVADIVATVANGGIKNRINIVDSVTDSDGNIVRNLRNKQGERIISKEVAERIKRLMEEVTVSGTGIEANMEEYGGAGGKTGSAETGHKGIVHAWFAGYFPQKDPRYSVAVFVENGQYGGKTAAPVFAEIAREMVKKGY